MLHVNSISMKLEEKKSILNKKHERSSKPVQVLYYRVSYSLPHYGHKPELQQVGCCCLVAKSCLFCGPMDCSSPGSSVQGISQTRILERVVISFSKGSFLTPGSNSNFLHWQVGSLPLSHQGSPPAEVRLQKNVFPTGSHLIFTF